MKELHDQLNIVSIIFQDFVINFVNGVIYLSVLKNKHNQPLAVKIYQHLHMLLQQNLRLNYKKVYEFDDEWVC